MSYQGDAAEQVVRLSLETGEVAVRLAGSGAKQVAILLYAILKDQQKTKGKIRLSNLLRSGKELKVFAVKDGDLQKFCQEAKKYGVLYCVLKDKNATDGITDIMVRAEDASKINRIFERFELATVDMAQIKREIERPTETEKGDTQKENPSEARSEKSPLSGPSSTPKDTDQRFSDPLSPELSRPSVRQKLAEIREGMKKTTEGRSPQNPLEHTAPKKNKPNKEKAR